MLSYVLLANVLLFIFTLGVISSFFFFVKKKSNGKVNSNFLSSTILFALVMYMTWRYGMDSQHIILTILLAIPAASFLIRGIFMVRKHKQ